MRTVELLSEESLRQELEEQGFDTSRLDDEAFQATPSSPDHPLPVSSSGDVYAALRVVGRLQKEIEEEEVAMREEIARVKKIRTRRIKAKKRSLDWLTVPLKNYIDRYGNYNGPAGYAGRRTVWKTTWKAGASELGEYAISRGLPVRLSVKGPVPAAVYEKLCQTLGNATIEVAADKNALKKFFRENEGDPEVKRERDRLFEKKKSSTYRFEPDFDR
jgi:hypothetical protein